jgi:DNA-binding transcriptional regulator YiaG
VQTRSHVPRTKVERDAARTAERIRRMLADDVRTMREDARLSLARLAQVSSVSKSYLHDIESGRVDATH